MVTTSFAALSRCVSNEKFKAFFLVREMRRMLDVCNILTRSICRYIFGFFFLSLISFLFFTSDRDTDPLYDPVFAWVSANSWTSTSGFDCSIYLYIYIYIRSIVTRNHMLTYILFSARFSQRHPVQYTYVYNIIYEYGFPRIAILDYMLTKNVYIPRTTRPIVLSSRVPDSFHFMYNRCRCGWNILDSARAYCRYITVLQ